MLFHALLDEFQDYTDYMWGSRYGSCYKEI